MTIKKARPRPSYYKLVLAGLAVHGCAVSEAKGAEFAIGGGYVADHSSNINRTATDEVSETTHVLLAGGAYRDTGPDLTINLSGLVQMNHYQHETFDDNTQLSAEAAVLWTISPQRFTWTLEDRASQTQRSIFDADTPDNQVNTNVIETGPDIYLRLGSTNMLDLGGRYGYLTFDDDVGDNDNERTTAFARWLYNQSAATTWSLNYELMRVRFAHPTPTNLDYSQTDTFARFETRPAHTHVIVDYGYSNVEREGGSETDNTLARLTWTRELTPQSTFSLIGSREFGDAGTVLLATLSSPATPGGPPTVREVATADLFYTRRGQAIYAYNGTDWAGNAELFYRDYDYEASTNQNREERGGHAELSWNPGGLLGATFFGDQQKTKYLNIERDDVDRIAGVRVHYRFARSFSAGAEVSDTRRRSTPDSSFDYVDRRIMLGLYYSSGPAFTPARR